MIDLAAVRADTPACENRIHFNNAGASLMPDPVYDAVVGHLSLERNIGGYEAARAAAHDLAAFYDEFAGLLNCHRDEVAYVENATRAWDMAFYGLKLGRGDRVLTHDSEYASNFMALLQQQRRTGFEIDLVPSDDTGQVDVDALESMVRAETRLIALTHVPTQGGLINPAAAVGEVAKRHHLVYLLDACQSAGQLELDVGRIGCHMLSGTGRKFLRGPRGTGFLYVSREVMQDIDPPFIDMHSAVWTGRDDYEFVDSAIRFEGFESFVAGRVGLARAVRYARNLGLANIEKRVIELGATLRRRLSDVPGVNIHDRGKRLCGIVTFTVDGEAAAETRDRLASEKINVSITERASARLEFEERGLDAVVRASVHYYNTGEEIDRVAEILS